MSTTNNTIIFITGGNTGLGLEIVKALCRSKHAYHIIIGTRTVSNGDAAIASVKQEYPSTTSTFEVVQADLTSDTSLESAIAHITSSHGRLDVLVNNGGANFDHALRDGKLSMRAAWNASWDTNVAGAQVLTSLAVPLLLASSNPRLIFMTSGTSSLYETTDSPTPALERINKSPEKGWPKPPDVNPTMAYRSSKTGLNMVMREWSKILGNDGVKVWCVSPGFLATALGGMDAEQLKKMGAIEPSEGGNFVVQVIEGVRDQDVGKVIRSSMIQPW